MPADAFEGLGIFASLVLMGSLLSASPGRMIRPAIIHTAQRNNGLSTDGPID
jgi:hypothetical protein